VGQSGAESSLLRTDLEQDILHQDSEVKSKEQLQQIQRVKNAVKEAKLES